MNALDLMIAIVGFFVGILVVLVVIAGWVVSGAYDGMKKGKGKK